MARSKKTENGRSDASPIPGRGSSTSPSPDTDRPVGPLSVVVPAEEREEVKVNNANVTELKNACDDAVKRYLSRPELFKQIYLHTDVRLGLGWASVFVAAGTAFYGYKVEFEQSKPVVWAGLILYIILTTIQTLYAYFVEGDTVYSGKRKTFSRRIVSERINLSSHTQPVKGSKQPAYEVAVTYVRSSSGGKSLLAKGKTHGVAEYSAFFDAQGIMDQEKFERWIRFPFKGTFAPPITVRDPQDLGATPGKQVPELQGPVLSALFAQQVATSLDMQRPHIAILGGGLTGLSSAFHLSRRHPEALISVFEKQTRLGGWVHSERAEVKHPEGGTANILLESGPRTLRPNAKSVLELVNLLGLKDSVITTPKTSPAAKNRYLQIPEVQAQGIVPLPSSIPSLLSSPLRSQLLPNVLSEPFKGRNRPAGIEDESFDDFMSRRFGASFARMFGSALVHGIYAADSRKLSIRAAFPSLWEAEERGRGSVVRGMLVPSKASSSLDDYDTGDVPEMMSGAPVFSFKDGMSTITNSLVRYLEGQPNVRIITDTRVELLDLVEGRIQLQTADGRTAHPDAVASALPLPVLHSVLPTHLSLPHLTANPQSSVTVINLVFPLTKGQPSIHPPGFGYLVPRSSSGYSEEGPGILGTVFDSSSLSAQDLPEDSRSRFVKLTVMLGGPHPITERHTTLDNVLKHLNAHLNSRVDGGTGGLALPKPALARTRHHVACIPTPTPGHPQRIEEMKEALSKGPWQGRLDVVGAGVRGVSVGDCVESGKRVGSHWSGLG
ncbi:oxygen-dependent protoporphyrinogen oxidase [Marasmius crinis-equi]|uniref:Signal peptidase complex subunit 2 n=1 Tax=Marasmius crinis-equi TaxID=585013 RepID=A0ABR3FBY8_9AGAR